MITECVAWPSNRSLRLYFEKLYSGGATAKVTVNCEVHGWYRAMMSVAQNAGAPAYAVCESTQYTNKTYYNTYLKAHLQAFQ